MNTDHVLLAKAAERLSRHAHCMGDLLLGDEIYRHLRSKPEATVVPIEEKAEQED